MPLSKEEKRLRKNAYMKARYYRRMVEEPDTVRAEKRNWIAEDRKHNPERHRATARRYAQAHPEIVKARYNEWISRNPDYHTQHSRLRAVRNPFYFMLQGARKRAEKCNIPFSITVSDVDIPAICPVLGIPLRSGASHKDKDFAPSLDRIIPSLGYIPQNVRVISWRANSLKNNGTAEELMAVALYAQRETERVRQELGLV